MRARYRPCSARSCELASLLWARLKIVPWGGASRLLRMDSPPPGRPPLGRAACIRCPSAVSTRVAVWVPVRRYALLGSCRHSEGRVG